MLANKNGLHVGWLLGSLIIVVIPLFAISSIMVQIEPPYHNITPMKILQHHRTITETFMNDQQREEWIGVLKNNKIISVRGLSENEGKTDRYIVELEGGYLAYGKECHPNALVDFEWPLVSFQDPKLPDLIYPRRSNRVLSGWSEVGTSAVADIVFPGHKLPAVLRSVSSNFIWNCPDFMSWRRWFMYHLRSETTVPISLSPYYHQITKSIPDVDYYRYLSRPEFPKSKVRGLDLDFAGQISDILVFDYLVDDHARQRSGNWNIDKMGKIIYMDGGLSFAHGPEGEDGCVDILCGAESWYKHSVTKIPPPPGMSCVPICKFRKSTIEQFKELSPLQSKEKRLSYKIEKKLEGVPIFDYAIYYPIESKHPRFQYLASDFYSSLDHRVAKFLGHVDACVTEFGEEFVFSDFD